jgi:hypothetical protein
LNSELTKEIRVGRANEFFIRPQEGADLSEIVDILLGAQRMAGYNCEVLSVGAIYELNREMELLRSRDLAKPPAHRND